MGKRVNNPLNNDVFGVVSADSYIDNDLVVNTHLDSEEHLVYVGLFTPGDGYGLLGWTGLDKQGLDDLITGLQYVRLVKYGDNPDKT